MNDLPRQTLSRIIAEHGTGICAEPKRIEALLRDLCGAHRREINIILGALEERVAADLLAKGKSVPREVLLARLAARLQDNLAYTTEAARWGVETWALALGVISEAELREHALSDAAEIARDSALPTEPSPPTTTPTGRSVNHQTPQPPNRGAGAPLASPPIPPKSPPKSAQTAPTTPIRPPSNSSRNAAVNSSNTAGAVVAAQPAPVQTASPALSSQQTPRRGLSLRGCLLVTVLIITLIIAAIFVVPAVILLLREEQSQPSINEPRIR